MYCITPFHLKVKSNMYIFLNIQAVQKCKKYKSSHTYLTHYISSRKVRDKRQQIRPILLCFGGCATKDNSVFMFPPNSGLSFFSVSLLRWYSVIYRAPFTVLFVLLLSNSDKQRAVLWVIPHLLNTHSHCVLGILENAQIDGQNFFLFYEQERNIKLNHFVWENY